MDSNTFCGSLTFQGLFDDVGAGRQPTDADANRIEDGVQNGRCEGHGGVGFLSVDGQRDGDHLLLRVNLCPMAAARRPVAQATT